MSDDDLEARYLFLQVHGRLINDIPVCCLHLTRQGEETPLHTMILTLDQADGLQVDLENAKVSALNQYIIRKAAFRDLENDLEAWKDLKPPSDDEDEQ